MNNKTIEKIKLSKERNKPKLLFTCNNYTIEKIPLNYRIMIKCAKRKKRQGIERDWYCSLEFGIEHAHNIADMAIDTFFIRDLPPEKCFKTK